MVNPIAEAQGTNPASGGFAAGSQPITPVSTGGSQIVDQAGSDYSRPIAELPTPGVMNQESGDKSVQNVPGFGAVDEFFTSQSANLNKKLGTKIGEGRLPYEASRTGVEQAKATVRETLERAKLVSLVIPSSTVRGDYDLIHVYSSITGSAVSLRMLPGGKYEFDTLIPEKSSKF
ncbi:hypothetical protein PSCICL_13050 [Pseudomonas cichorii]|nr:hypothetical protein PSCICL_13050 [Pseudomonas cichorii]